MVATTVLLGFRSCFPGTPWQATYIAVYCAFIGTVVESVIIDSDHWRHYFLLLGVLWGLMAASRSARRVSAAGPALAPAHAGSVAIAAAERSAARLAHQSGGLGVPSSNLGAPTNPSLKSNSQKLTLGSVWEGPQREERANRGNYFLRFFFLAVDLL